MKSTASERLAASDPSPRDLPPRGAPPGDLPPGGAPAYPSRTACARIARDMHPLLLPWFAYVGELGRFALGLAFAAAALQALAPLLLVRERDPARAFALAAAAARGGALACALAFVLLLLAFARNDFSLQAVASNSHSLLPVPWRLVAAWGNHEGSLLLWCLLLALCGLVLTRKPTPQGQAFAAAALGVQGALQLAFLSFLRFTSSPFAPQDPPPLDGAALNPVLQDPALAVHPPLLYLGYVGLSLSWSLALAALLTRTPGTTWARAARPWALAAWSALTAGLALGSWWAYYELGWGGWWFWDPVENLALMPWLVATAQIHALSAAARGQFIRHAFLLTLCAALLALLATFAVRSGLLISVHSFAASPARGIVAFAILAIAGTASFTLYALRGQSLSPRAPASARDALLLLNILALPALACIVLVGTFYPLALRLLLGYPVSVGEGYYALAFVPLALPLVLAAALAPRIDADQARSGRTFVASVARARIALALAVLSFVAVVILAPLTPWLARVAMAFAVFLAVETALFAFRSRAHPGAVAAMVCGHFGFAIFVFAAAGAAAWQDERSALLLPGERLVRNQHTFRFESLEGVAGPNWLAEQARITWQSAGADRKVLLPQRRLYPASETTTAETDIATTLVYDLHAVLGEEDAQGRRRLVMLWRPLVPWLWPAFALVSLSGLLAARRAMRTRGVR